MFIIKKTKNIDVNVEKSKPSYTAVGMKSNPAILQKVKHRSSNSTPMYTPKGNENIYPNKNVHINVHSSIIHNSPNVKPSHIAFTNEWINKIWYICTM